VQALRQMLEDFQYSMSDAELGAIIDVRAWPRKSACPI
jgi:hypothetical protein